MNFLVRVVAALFLASLTLASSEARLSSAISCQEIERDALLIFKQHLIDSDNRLASWIDGTDCCVWNGIVCDNVTGHVLQLHLRNPIPRSYFTHSEYEIYEKSGLSGQLSDSLLNLKHLRYLDLSNNCFGGIEIPQFISSIEDLRYLNLSWSGFEGVIPSLVNLKHLSCMDLSGNYFGGSSIPKFIGSMTSLRYLSLSNAGFGGKIPHLIGNLSNLQHLDLNNAGTTVTNLQWLSGLSSLQYLDMSYLDLSLTSDSMQVISQLLFLTDLKLSSCSLYSVPELFFLNISSLITLDLSENQLSKSFFIDSHISSLSSLVDLDLSLCLFSGSIPIALQNLTSLESLSLIRNYFNGSLPSWLFNFSNLKTLRLTFNQFKDRIPDSIGNLTSIVDLELGGNSFEGKMPRSLGNLCQLQNLELFDVKMNQDLSEVLEILSGCVADGLSYLDLSSCQLSGYLTKLKIIRNIVGLFLSKNKISGPITFIGPLSSLQMLSVAFNSLEGNLTEVFFSNLKRLYYFYASYNPLALTVNPDWIPPFQLNTIGLSSWRLGPQFPQWLSSQRNLNYLDISCTGIKDVIPSWFWTLFSDLQFVNFSRNTFYGKIPDRVPFFGVYELDLSYNQFEGPLPRFFSRVNLLDVSNNLFSGSLSDFLCYEMEELRSLEALHLGDNHFSGKIPDCWMNWPRLNSVQLQNNNFTGKIPKSIGSLSELQWLHLRNNRLSGKFPWSLRDCRQLLGIDLAENEFFGRIPSWFGERFSDAKILSLRSNNFHGHITHSLCSLSQLQILDFADNNLSGNIPKCFARFYAMTSLENIDDYGVLTSSGSQWMDGGDYIENAILVVKGVALEYSKNLYLEAIIDLSNNNLSGAIPEEITRLAKLHSLNLSGNYLTGKIPEDISNFVDLESIDFSSNQLCGQIPESMAKMNFLSFLNLSYNNLTGSIPIGTQLQSFNASSYVGNNLCGPPLSENCSPNGEETPNLYDAKDEDSEVHEHGHGVKSFYVSLTLGFLVGFWGVVGPLLYSMPWRIMYFQWLDCLWFRIQTRQ